jgi:hypothetical protein
MKNYPYKLFIILFFALSSNLVVVAKRNDVEKRKVIEKSYQVDDNVLLDINNQFGKVHINTWDKGQMDVTIEIIARKRSESRAQELLERIDIDIDESPTSKRFITELKGNFNNNSNGTFEINYTINMPKNNPLRLKNKFGNTYVGDLTNDVKLLISYGDIKTGSFIGDSDIKLSFGDGEFKYVKSGELEIKYSDVEIEELGIVRLEQGFSDVEIDKAESIDLTSKYGDLEIGTVVGIKGYVGYSGFEIDRLLSELDIEASYASGFRISEVAKGFSKINISGKFGSYKLGFEDGVNATFDARMKFSEMDYSGLDIEFSYRVKEDFKAEYRGKIGNGSGGEIRIVSSYGDVRFY